MLESVAVDHLIAENGKILLALRVELCVVVFLGQKFQRNPANIHSFTPRHYFVILNNTVTMTLYNICFATIHNLTEFDLSEAQFNALTAAGFSVRDFTKQPFSA